MKARGYCLKHWREAKKAGEFIPRRQAKRGLSLAERFEFIGWDERPNGCWNWKGSVANGYGRIARNNADHDVLAHRVSYEIYVGSIPRGMGVHHKCSNRRCVNPQHLEVTTDRENMGEMMERNYYISRIRELEEQVAGLKRLLRDAQHD